jgi:hypothetical protein
MAFRLGHLVGMNRKDEKGSSLSPIVVIIPELPTGTEENREEPEDSLSQDEIFIRNLSDTKKHCCTLGAKYGILVKRNKIM